MGDMKTPDFDDLLAAFDIPDIDAKEAIQSTPDEPEGGHRPGAGGDPPSDPPGVSVIVKNTVRQEGFGEAGSDTEKPDGRPLPTGAMPASEQSLEMQNGFCVPSSPISSPSSSSSSSSSPSSSPSSNSFSIPSIAANSSEATKPLGLQHPQTVSNGDLWSPLSPKTSRETPGSSSISSIRGSITSLSGGNSADLSEHCCKATNIFSRLRPLVAQSPVDLIGKGRERKGLLQQQQQVHLQQHRKRRGDGGGEGGGGDDDEMEIEESAASSASGVPDASPGVGVPFFAPPKTAPAPPSPATAAPPVSTSTLNLEPQNSNPSPRLLGSPPPPAPPDPSSTTTTTTSSSALFERNREPAQARPTGGRYSPGSTGFCSEESEPDIGSPLVIQESLESPTSSPPGSPGEKTREPSPVASSQPTTPQKYPEAPACPPPLTLPQPWPQPRCPATTDDLGSSRKKSPEHIVEERDSPQSPEPEIQTPLNNKTPLSNSVASAVSSGGSGSIAGDDDDNNNNNNNPAPSLPLLPSSPGAKQEEGEGEPKSSSSHSAKESRSIQDSPESPSEEEEGEEGGGGGGEEGEVMEAADEEGRGSLRKVESGKNTNGSNGKGGNKSASSTSSSSAPSRPLKVRIKTVKTSSGGITRTVTHVAPRSAAGIPHPPTATAAIPMETEAGGGGGGREGAVSRKPTQTAEAPKRKPVSLQLGDGARLKGPILPASTIQNASSAMLMAASKAQGRIAALAGATKPEKTKPLAKAAMGRPALSPANQKAVNGAASKPASIVNSGGAVISRSQTSLVEAFNRILNSKNLLPSYQPDLSPPAEWSLELPQCGYRCLECGDAFALERSLARHYDRRSMRIEVTCNHCARRLVFFNKCSLLLHAREHKDTGLVMQCSHLVMRPVSVEQMIGQQPDLTPATGLSKVRNAAAAATGGASNGGQGTPGEALTGPGGKKKEAPLLKPQPQPQPQPALPLSCRKEELLQYRNFKCPECKKQFKGKTELAAHFQEVVSGSDSSCTQCAPVMMMSNPCSGSAHRRMHRHQAPHVCPECGGVARPAGFQTHLKEACLHFSRRIGYKCSSCQVVFGGLNSIKSHIQSVHCEVFHKCPTCPMAFKSAPGAHAHISTQHPGLENQQAKMIYKCVMCDTVFTHKALLHTHFDMHLAKQKVHVFKCPDCTKLYAQKTSMMEHIKSTHRNGGTKPEPPPPAPAQRPSPQKAVRSAGPVKPEPRPSSSSEDEEEGDEEEEEEEEEEGGSSPDPPRSLRDGEEGRVPEWRCFECRARFSERDEYITHMRKDHGKSVKKFPCRLCDRSFCSAPSLRRHVRVNHEGIKRVFHCEYCTEGKRTFSSRLILEKHVRVRHGIRKWGPSSDSEGPARKRRAPLERDSSSDTEGGAAGGGGGGVRRRRMRVSTPTKIRKRKAPQPQPEPAGPFSCQKCGFTTESRPEFQAHIPQHRSDESSHQCSHCGLCFASQPSLNRHCFITHRVKQPSPAGDPSEGEEGPGQQGGLACQVCGKLCETAVDLRTHFRTHGMAFIRATKTGGAEK
ncbi:zinc finger protein 687b [Acipenser ruthenus]|uniref:zinc finger protein 687b n=1 Tax=Acipenser ruthenus TaxID=7906 RepID=UPI0027412468|nr:zinc finger protein 687b [Acipenser ruthenus]XP_058862244.1 zinc finger protein 687b [Acipenser ruthenus]